MLLQSNTEHVLNPVCCVNSSLRRREVNADWLPEVEDIEYLEYEICISEQKGESKFRENSNRPSKISASPRDVLWWFE